MASSSSSSDPTYPLFPIFAFLACVVVLIPLPWHLQAWNSGTCCFMIWVFALCFVEFVNALVWSGNVDNVAPVWCDISCQIILGAGVGIPASVLCISRRLYSITACRTVSISRDDKIRTIIQDLAIAIGIPLLCLAMHVVVQGHRFDILEDVGCYPVTYDTLPAYFLYYAWPIGIGAVSFVYSCLTLRSFYARRLQLTQMLASNKALNPSRFLRLMALSMFDIMCSMPLACYVMYVGAATKKIEPWISWADTHYNFWYVKRVPALLWRSEDANIIAVELTRWVSIFCALLFFALFGFAEEAKVNYRRWFWAVAKRAGFEPPSNGVNSAKKWAVMNNGKSSSSGMSSSTPKVPLPTYSPPRLLQSQKGNSDSTTNLFSPGSSMNFTAFSPTTMSSHSAFTTTSPTRVHDSFISLPDIELSPRIQLDLDDPSFSRHIYAHTRMIGDLEKGLPAIPTSPSTESIAGPSSPPPFYTQGASMVSTCTFGSPTESCRSLPYTGLGSDDGSDNDRRRLDAYTYPASIADDSALPSRAGVLRTPEDLPEKSSDLSLTSSDRSDAIYVTTELVPAFTRPPSPPPFTNLGRPSVENYRSRPSVDYHRPLSPPQFYPLARPFRDDESSRRPTDSIVLNGIIVSHSQETL